MISKEIIIKNQVGLESRSAAMFIQKASNFKSGIWLEKGDRKANAKSLLGVLSLGIGNGMKVRLTAEGEDEDRAGEELEEYLAITGEQTY
jgi:phosphocarrier protein HPr